MSLAALAGAALAWVGFVALLFAASLALPGRVQEGRALPGGEHKRYRLNGLAVFAFAAVVVAATTLAGLWSPSLIVHAFWPLVVAANVFALAASAILWLAGRRAGPHRLRDVLTGVEADPTWLGVDLKLFSYRPSLIALALLNVAFAFAQWERHGVVSTGMWLYQAFTLVYVVNYFHFEHGMLFTYDLLAERFGLGLVWGNYVLVPFFYSLPGWYLVDRIDPLPTGAAPALVLLYYAWALPCGFASPVPYLPALWLTLFFPHRARRDDRRCRDKYGALWTAYCARVRWRMLPYVF